MKKIKNLLLLILPFFVMGCLGPGKLMNGWIGKTKDQLYKTWGQPENVISNGADGIIVIYSAKADLYDAPTIHYSNEGDGYTRMDRPANGKSQYTKLKMFYIHPDGIIYSWKMKDI